MNFVTVATTDEMQPGDRIVVEIDDVWVVIFNVGGTYYAINDICTHEEYDLSEGYLDGYSLECAKHGAQFDIRTGKVLAPPALVPVKIYEVRVVGDENSSGRTLIMQTLLDEFYEGRTLVFGHRGARAYAPMNTLPSFELVLDQGADGIELDVRLTRDDEMIIMHDADIDSTTDGHGALRDFTLSELLAFDAGSWFNPLFTGTRVPTLDQVFEAFGKKTRINVEIKAESLLSDGVEAKVADAIRRHDLARSVIVSSFNPLTLRRFRHVLPEVPIGFLHEPSTDFFTSHLMIGLHHEARNPYHEEIDTRYMAWAKRSGYRVNTWTVNDPARAVALRDLGVDCIITDAPDVILAALRGA